MPFDLSPRTPEETLDAAQQTLDRLLEGLRVTEERIAASRRQLDESSATLESFGIRSLRHPRPKSERILV